MQCEKCGGGGGAGWTGAGVGGGSSGHFWATYNSTIKVAVLDNTQVVRILISKRFVVTVSEQRWCHSMLEIVVFISESKGESFHSPAELCLLLFHWKPPLSLQTCLVLEQLYQRSRWSEKIVTVHILVLRRNKRRSEKQLLKKHMQQEERESL